MRKIILLSAIMIATNLFGQKQEQENVTLELEFAPLGASPLKISSLRGRYFIDDIQAFRLSLYMGGKYTPTKEEEEGQPTLISKDKTFDFVFRPGYEYHFEGTDKLSPYLGTEVYYALSTTNNSYQGAIGNEVQTTTTKFAKSTLGLNILAGGDYYFTDKVYLGVELGFGLTREGRGKTKVEYDNYPAGEDEPDDVVGNSTTLNWGPNYQATIRLGFCIK